MQLILPHHNFGNHLDSTGKTIDKKLLDMRNFKRAGETLCEIWNNLSIDGYAVKTVYVEPKNEEFPPFPVPDPVWYQKLVRESQYLLQIVKCNDL